ncbi:MAG: nucleoside hydrolase [Paenibacillaceae bacterium]|jgi:purine nucleosidase|nr:nucleoside hydrolase [Paenibacillaceae bacterium]
MSIPLIFDSDMIGDDILALIAAAGLPVELRAVTAYGRRVSATERACLAVKLLHRLGLAHVPAAAGASRPLLRAPRIGCTACDEPIFQFLSRGRTDDGPDDRYSASVDSRPAAQLIIDLARDAPHEITVLCTGPLTNLATAVVLEPRLAEWIKEVVIMGGVAWVPGRSTPVSESNIYNDPEAAAIVFDRFPRITMVGLDVTMQTLIGPSALHELLDHTPDLQALATGIVSSCITKQAEQNLHRMPLHDPLALIAVCEPSLLRTIPCQVQVETGGQYTLGQTVCRPLTASEQNEHGRKVVLVATEVDSERAIAMFQESIRKALEASASTPNHVEGAGKR